VKGASYCYVCHHHWDYLATHLWVAHGELVLMVLDSKSLPERNDG